MVIQQKFIDKVNEPLYTHAMLRIHNAEFIADGCKELLCG